MPIFIPKNNKTYIMNERIDELRRERILLLTQTSEAKTNFLKNKIQKRLKTINKALFKETKNTIYL